MKYPVFESALCSSIGVEPYYPVTKTLDTENRIAIKLCKRCPELNKCLEWALVHEDQGIWAGTTPNDRKRIRKDRGITFKPLTGTDFVRGLT
jgi:hypothetical protein